MERDAVLVKTAKGADEVKSRAHGLAARLRSVLIMIDGRSTVGEYVARFGAIPDIEATLQALADQEFVAVSEQRAAAPHAAPRDAGRQAARKEAIAGLCALLIDALGPDADVLTSAVERARTRVEFEEAAERCAHVLESLGARGKARAERFRERAREVAGQVFAA